MFIGKCNELCFSLSLRYLKISLESVQYRSLIRFLYLKGKCRGEIQVELNAVYDEQSPPLVTVKSCFNEFK